ncbi:MAG TPA: type II toxin-antitoxin system VapC family toxin [Bryobacteraceae bacterium]|nr:type II toxin-antitoxin system VapC family toxin [Bryobacteraceae bacterium]
MSNMQISWKHDVEISQALRRYLLPGKLDPAHGSGGSRRLRGVLHDPLPHTLFLPRIRQLRLGVMAYDVVYLALAERLEAPLLTRDAALVRFSGHRAKIELI